MKKIALLGILSIFLIANLAFARGYQKGGVRLPHGKWWIMPEVAEKLNLTDNEKTQLDALFVKSKKEIIDLKSEIKKQRLDLDQLLSSPTLDETVCTNKFNQIQDLRTQLAAERFKHLIEVRKILGNKRFEELRGIYKQTRMDKRGGRGGQWQGKGQGFRQPFTGSGQPNTGSTE
jgi:Spy/CpxP family protein refolding chaperone